MSGEEDAAGPGQATAAGEKSGHRSATLSDREGRGPLQDLIDRLEAPTNGCGVVPIRAGGELQIAPAAGGYAIGRRR